MTKVRVWVDIGGQRWGYQFALSRLHVPTWAQVAREVERAVRAMERAAPPFDRRDLRWEIVP